VFQTFETPGTSDRLLLFCQNSVYKVETLSFVISPLPLPEIMICTLFCHAETMKSSIIRCTCILQVLVTTVDVFSLGVEVEIEGM
jgi:hypothetical protein